MDYDALSASQKRTFRKQVSQSHRRRVELVILTKDDKVIRSIHGRRILGGSIDGDEDRTPAEVLQMQVFDDDFALDWRQGEHRKFKARVIDSRYVADFDDWVDTIVFTGPLWDFERRGCVVSLVAQGSERLAMGSVRRVFHRPRKAKATSVVRDLLQAAGAPTRGLKIPRLPNRLPRQVTVGVRRGKRRDTNGKKKGLGKDTRKKTQILKVDREDTYWGEAAAIVHSLNRDLYADGRGRYVMNRPQSKAMARLTNRQILEPVTEKRGDDAEVTNTWVIEGGKPKGAKKAVRVEVAFPKKHDLSAESQAWHNKPREVTEVIENKQIKRHKDAVALGMRERARAMKELVTYEVSVLPIILRVRPGAPVSVPVGNGRRASARARRWTLPLGPGADPVTIGANRRVR